MRKTLTMALLTAAMLGFAPGVAVSGEADTADPLSGWTKLAVSELSESQALGVGVYGDENVVAEDSYNFTQNNDADVDLENEDSPLINKGDNARLTTGRIYGDYIAYNRGLMITSKVSGNLNNVSILINYNIYFEQH